MYGNPLAVLFPQRDHDLSRDCREVLVVGCSTNSSNALIFCARSSLQRRKKGSIKSWKSLPKKGNTSFKMSETMAQA
jgi:hypothetical protein